MLALDDDAFRARFARTPVKRTGRDRFVRNALIAAGNTGERTLLPRVLELLDDPSPLVRAMAIWALGQLGSPDEIVAARDRCHDGEPDPDVAREWTTATEGGQ